MVALTSITLALILAAVAAFVYGTVQISRYAFRVSTGRGLAALLFPPYTVYFAFYGLDEEGKETPTAAWMFGILVGTILILLFFQPLQLLVTGQLGELRAEAPEASAAAAQAEREEPDGETGETGDEPKSESVPAEQPDDPSASGDSDTSEESADSKQADASGEDEGESSSDTGDGTE